MGKEKEHRRYTGDIVGVKTKLELEEIRAFFDVQKLTPTINGISDTVYILDDKYILKLFEDSSLESLDEEIRLLELCEDLPISKIVKKPFIIKNKPAMIYEKCSGKSLDKTSINSIEQIGRFLKEFHTITKNKSTSNIDLFEKSRVQKLIDKTGNNEFQKIFDTIDIELKNDGIIHGDLFMDNATFIDDKLSCVFDLNDTCNGDFIYDLAVVALSWCKDEKEYQILLESYGLDIKMDSFIKYIKYGMLYYSITRYLDGRDFESLLKRCKEI